MIVRLIPLALALAMLAAGPALAQHPGADIDWTDGVLVDGGSSPPGNPTPAAFHFEVGPVTIHLPQPLVWSGTLSSFQDQNGVLKGVETTCVVCDGPCDPPALNNAGGWGTRVDPIVEYQGQGTTQGNATYSGGPWIIDVYMDTYGVVNKPEDMTHYWCGNFLWGYPHGSANSLDRVLPDYGTSLPLWARLGPGGTTVQSGVLPFK